MKDSQPDKKKILDEEGFDVVGLLLEYLAQWKWFVLSIVVCFILGYVFVSTIVPIYEVSASIYLSSEDEAKGRSVASLGLDNQMFNAQNYLDETQIEILKSRNNLIKIVDSLDLAYGYYEVAKFRDNPIYGTNAIEARLDSVSLKQLSYPITIFVSKSDDTYKFDISTKYGGADEQKTIETDSLPISVELSQGTLELKPSFTTAKLDAQQKIVISNPNWVAARLSANLNIGFARNSSTILRINFNTPMVPEGIDVINTLIDIYNKDIIADKNRSALQTEAFIIERLALIAGELQDVEKEVENYRREKKITDISTEAGMYLNQTTETDAQLAEYDLKRQLVSEVEKMVAVQDDYTPIPLVVEDPALSAMIESYNKKLAQRSAILEGGGTENNPIVQNMQDDLARSKKEIHRGLSNVKHSLNLQRRTLERKDERIEGRISNIPTYERELTGIFREQRIKDNIYNFLLEKREEIALQKTLATPTARLIDNPLGSGPVAPKRMKFFGFSILLGLLIPALIILLRRIIFPIFKDKEDLERATKIPIIGEVSLAEDVKHSKFVVSNNVATPIAELFRLIRNNLKFALAEKNGKVILITSSLSGEGKTFVATNIALTFALTGQKTLVIGMDIRRPVLAHNFDFNNDKGVTTYLSGQMSNIQDAILQSNINENLDVLPAGPVPPNPNELLLNDRLEEMIESLKSHYDYIIIDSAPIGVVSDTFLISPYTDVQLYVARANYSTKSCLKVLHQAVATYRLKNCYLVLNGVNINSGTYSYRRYGYYGKYGYKSYGYGYGYVDKPTAKSRLKRLWRRAKKQK